jgi:undecaprenyl pyrophosphate synthase
MRFIKVPTVLHILFGMYVTRLSEQFSSHNISVRIIQLNSGSTASFLNALPSKQKKTIEDNSLVLNFNVNYVIDSQILLQ